MVLLRGELTELPRFSHENHGRSFDRMTLEVERLSGVRDIIHVIADHALLEELDPTAGTMVEVEGQVRSFNNRTGEGRRLIISVYAASILACDGLPENRVYLRGRICREPVYRRTPLGREICDVMLAVERRYGRTDYLPCILWGSLARLAGEDLDIVHLTEDVATVIANDHVVAMLDGLAILGSQFYHAFVHMNILHAFDVGKLLKVFRLCLSTEREAHRCGTHRHSL